MSNPYQTPAFDPRQFQDQPAGPAAAYGPNWVGQVRIFAVLNAVQGILEVLMGLMLTAIGGMLPMITQMKEVKEAKTPEGMPPEQFFWLFGAIYIAIGLIALSSGILRIVAGVQNYRFKSRVLGLVSVIVGVAPIFTCYCAPTAIGMLVYGLIIHLDPAVVAAFKMAAEGKTASQVLTAFDPDQASYYSPPQPPEGPMPPPT
ncbi:MAG TPA: hypothetical protein VGI40_00965 [Pirellulaceae bacterium]|jgi:hypothetical protein